MLEISGTTLLTRLVTLLERHVDNIHLVVGYREEMVIDHCAKHHPRVIVVRNPDFRTTNTAYSLSLGARSLQGKCIFLDGDLIFSPQSLDAFLTSAREVATLVGLCKPSTENAVFARVDEIGDRLTIRSFTREERTAFEWANVVCGSATLFENAGGYVFETLAAHAPLQGHLIDIAEVDTAADLIVAEKFIKDNML